MAGFAAIRIEVRAEWVRQLQGVFLSIDLHSHSTASDGELTPAQLMARAHCQGVRRLAITDHDTVDGLSAAAACDSAVELIPGVELSCVWGKRLIHVVGLGIDPECEVLTAGLGSQHQARELRARMIAERLEKYGFKGGYDYAAGLAAGGQIGRPHFARFLVERGHVANVKEAFKKYLGAGKPGDIKLTWPPMAEVIGWIRASGGVAVLAHPLHYKLTATRRNALVSDFREAGGVALEVINGRQPADRTRTLAELACRFELLASLGSDFHQAGMPWSELGQMGELPRQCRPVWAIWE